MNIHILAIEKLISNHIRCADEHVVLLADYSRVLCTLIPLIRLFHCGYIALS